MKKKLFHRFRRSRKDGKTFRSIFGALPNEEKTFDMFWGASKTGKTPLFGSLAQNQPLSERKTNRPLCHFGTPLTVNSGCFLRLGFVAFLPLSGLVQTGLEQG